MIDIHRADEFCSILKLTDYRVYPLVVPKDVPMPFVVYSRNGIETDADTKDCNTFSMSYSVNVVCKSYSESLDVAQAIIRTMVEHDIEFTDANESYDDASMAYVQELQFTMNYE